MKPPRGNPRRRTRREPLPEAPLPVPARRPDRALPDRPPRQGVERAGADTGGDGGVPVLAVWRLAPEGSLVRKAKHRPKVVRFEQRYIGWPLFKETRHAVLECGHVHNMGVSQSTPKRMACWDCECPRGCAGIVGGPGCDCAL